MQSALPRRPYDAGCHLAMLFVSQLGLAMRIKQSWKLSKMPGLVKDWYSKVTSMWARVNE